MGEIDVLLRRKDRPGSRGYQYEVWRGMDLLCTSRDPEYTVCRRLAETGIEGRVRFWRERPDVCTLDSFMDIERGAKCSTTESSKSGIRIGKYNDFWHNNQEDNEELEAAA